LPAFVAADLEFLLEIEEPFCAGDLPGFEGVQSRFSGWQAAFDAMMEEPVEVVGYGDMLGVVYDLHAHNQGEFMGVPPTHQPVVIPGIEFLRFKDGKIAAHWGIYDFMTTADEIGAELQFKPRTAPGLKPEVAWNRGITADGEATE
jgi:predicted ester cyclase